MSNWFECKVRYETIMGTGKQKKVTVPYLVDAMSFTEAEARIIKEVTPFTSGELTVVSIKRESISEIFDLETGDRWYRARVAYVTIDERSGAEKKTSVNMIVKALDIDEAKDNLRKCMDDTMSDYVITQLKETNLMDIFTFSS